MYLGGGGGDLYPIYVKKKIVVLASEPVGGRSRATELPNVYVSTVMRSAFADISVPLPTPGFYVFFILTQKVLINHIASIFDM